MPSLRFDRIQTVLFLLSLPVIFGCFPVIAHGPRVESGTSVALLTAAEMRPDGSRNGDLGPFMPNVGLGVNAGWRSSNPDGGGVQLGVHIPASVILAPMGLTPFLLQGDLYFQVPPSTTGPLQAGLGVHGSYRRVMPYFQMGRIGESGSGWYTTQGVMVGWARDYYGHEQPYTAWMPSLAYQSAHRNTTTHFFASALVGMAEDFDYGDWGGQSAFSAGMIVVFEGRKR
jgi:hypothetical protein